MSGGSYGYAYHAIEALADEIAGQDVPGHRKKFAELLRLVAKAAHDIEWVDSCDYADGDELEAIDACFLFASRHI